MYFYSIKKMSSSKSREQAYLKRKKNLKKRNKSKVWYLPNEEKLISMGWERKFQYGITWGK